ncbi:MAG: ATP-binding protein [Prevotella sp.]|nr:ATP-binding protein [Prevotella sp.]
MATKNFQKQQNPFIYLGYAGPDYFFDRTEESEELIENLKNGRNTTLISPRRIGKTGLINHVFYLLHQQDKNAVCIYIDIFSTKNQHDFVQLLGTAIAQYTLSYEQKALNRLLEFFGSWRPVFSADPITGMPTVSVSIEPTQSALTLKTIFDYMNQSKHHIYIAIDEFQQIMNYPETGTEALLRSYVQFATNVTFIFSGSKQHLMAQMFSSPDRPFYQSTASMGLEPINEEIYYDYASRLFEKKKSYLDRDVFRHLYQRFDGVTYNIQVLLNHLYASGRRVETDQQVAEAILHIVGRSAMQYEGLVTFLTDNQFQLLKAIAKEGVTKSPQSGEFLRKYGLPSASSVKTALDVLVDKDLVYNTSMGYIVYDRFMGIWLKRLV